jgi:hypothetical protein
MWDKNKLIRGFIIGTFVLLYIITSLISTIHVIDFFRLSNPEWLAISLALAFEIGAGASLASLIVLEKMNRVIVWGLFITLTLVQAMGNTFYAYTHLNNFEQWIELFGLVDEDPIYQKRILSIISGAILPLVSLGFIKSLVDYIKPEGDSSDELPIEESTELEADISIETEAINDEVNSHVHENTRNLRDLVYRETTDTDPTKIR